VVYRGQAPLEAERDWLADLPAHSRQQILGMCIVELNTFPHKDNVVWLTMYLKGH
jgi:hypothetical protein